MRNVMIAASLAVVGLMIGCSSPCDALQDLCNKCKDASTKASCTTIASDYKALVINSGSSCQAVLDAKTFDSCNN